MPAGSDQTGRIIWRPPSIDIALPAAGWLFVWVYVWLARLSPLNQMALLVFVAPILVALLRAHLAKRRAIPLSHRAALRRISLGRQITLGVGIAILLFLEGMFSILTLARGAPMIAWLWIAIPYALYLTVMTAYRYFDEQLSLRLERIEDDSSSSR